MLAQKNSGASMSASAQNSNGPRGLEGGRTWAVMCCACILYKECSAADATLFPSCWVWKSCQGCCLYNVRQEGANSIKEWWVNSNSCYACALFGLCDIFMRTCQSVVNKSSYVQLNGKSVYGDALYITECRCFLLTWWGSYSCLTAETDVCISVKQL